MCTIQETGVMDCSAGVAPSHLIGPAMQGGVRATFVRVQPAGVEVSHEDGLIAWNTLVLVRFHA